MALKLSIHHEKEAFLIDLMQKSREIMWGNLVLTEVLINNPLTQNGLLMNQNDPIFLNNVFQTLATEFDRNKNRRSTTSSEGSILGKVIEITGRPSTQENIFHILSSGSHFESCALLVNTLEDAVVARLMLTRSSITKKSPLILALSSKAEDTTEDSQESAKAGKSHPQSLLAKLFWETCEKAVLNNLSLMESLKVCTYSNSTSMKRAGLIKLYMQFYRNTFCHLKKRRK